MSLIEKKNLNYLTTVEQFFLSLKDSGLHLSASDTHLVSQWEEREIPVERWLTGARTVDVLVPTNARVMKVEIDAEQVFPDANRRNNIWERT